MKILYGFHQTFPLLPQKYFPLLHDSTITMQPKFLKC